MNIKNINLRLRYLTPLFVSVAMLALAACGSGPEPVVVVELPPTWTPTPYVEPTPALATPTPIPAPPTNTPLPALPTNTPFPAEPTEEPTPVAPPTDTPAPTAKLIVTGSQANLRGGPGTAYDRVGVVRQGDEIIIIGKNVNGDWWQISYNEQPAWIFQDLVQVQNPEVVVVAQNIPAPPARPTQPPPAPTNTPIPAPPPAADPCASIGGDGCKWRISGGPAFSPYDGELKLTLGFVHSGRGNEAQGSYRVVLTKNGTEIPSKQCPASTTGSMNSGPHGPYNHECKINLNSIPDGNEAGQYEGYVIDGNHERDSRNFTIVVPEGQGDVWILFDQA